MRGASALVLCAAALLAACGGNPAAKNPDFFNFRANSGVLNGWYNAAGYTPEQIQTHIKLSCNGETIVDYTEGQGENGLTTFTATCPDGSKLSRGYYEVERTASGSYVVETMGK